MRADAADDVCYGLEDRIALLGYEVVIFLSNRWQFCSTAWVCWARFLGYARRFDMLGLVFYFYFVVAVFDGGGWL